VKCAHCGAAYQFPVDQVPHEGLRAKCASCGQVVELRREPATPHDLGEAPPVVAAPKNVARLETPPPDLRPPTEPPPGLAKLVEARAGATVRRDSGAAQRGVRVGDARRDKRDQKRKSRQKTHSTKKVAPRAEKAAGAAGGAKVIVDMGQLGEKAAEADARRRKEEEAEHAAQAAFSPLATPAALPPPAELDRARAYPSTDAFGASDDADIKPVRPPGMWRLVVLAVVLVLGAGFLLVWERNDWRPIWEDPELAFRVAVGKVEAPPPPPPPKAPVVETATMEGQLEFRDLTLEMVSVGRKRHAAVVRGTLANQTNRVQKGVTLEAGFQRAGLPVRQRVAVCCDTFDTERVKEIVLKPDHPHFSDLDRASITRLRPGESRPFTVILPDVETDQAKATDLVPHARVRFAEAESTAP
jgi:hypothetical protein